MLLILCLIYGSMAVVSVAWFTEAIHEGMALRWTLAYLAAINITAFAFYVYDKIFVGLLNALHMRVPEILLIWGLAFPGGWAGALAAMFVVHHKTGPDSAEFRMELLMSYALCISLILLALAITGRPPVTLEQSDAAVADLTAFVMRGFRATLEAARGL